MASMIDIIIAMGLGATLLIIILNANGIAGEDASIMHGDALVQQLLVSTTQFMEGEFRNMGYGMADIDSATIMRATDSSISFLSDVDRDGTIDTVKYWLGPVSELASTQNDSDRLLHRQVNGGGVFAVGAVTRFSMRYFSQGLVDTLVPPKPPSQPNWTIYRYGGIESAPPPIDMREIKVIEITLEVQNPYALYRKADEIQAGTRSAFFSSSLWRQTRLASQNLRR